MSANSSFRLLARGAAGAFLVQVVGAALGLVVHAVIARHLGPSAYGSYALALTWVSFLVVLVLSGQDVSVVRYVPRYIHHSQWAELRGLRRGVGGGVFVATIVMGLAGALVVHLLRGRLSDDLGPTLYAAFALLVVLAQLQLSGSLHRALKRAVSAKFFNSFVRPMVLLAFVSLFTAVYHQHLTAQVAMLASGFGTLCALISSEFLLAGAWPVEAKRVRPRYDPRAWLALGRQLLFVAIIGIVLRRVDVLILGAFAGTSAVGPYYAAVQLADLAVYGLNAVNTILAPIISERYAAADHSGLAALVHRAAWLTFTLGLVAAFAAAFFGRQVLALFGSGFEVAYVPLLIILGGQCINAAAGPVDSLLTMTRFERYAPPIFGGGALLNIMMSLVLVPAVGMLGAAVAAATSTIAWNVAAFLFVRAKLHVNPTILPISIR